MKEQKLRLRNKEVNTYTGKVDSERKSCPFQRQKMTTDTDHEGKKYWEASLYYLLVLYFKSYKVIKVLNYIYVVINWVYIDQYYTYIFLVLYL